MKSIVRKLAAAAAAAILLGAYAPLASAQAPVESLELEGQWRDTGGNEYTISKEGDSYVGTLDKVNDSFKSTHFEKGEQVLRKFNPVPGQPNTFKGEIKCRSRDEKDTTYPRWLACTITLKRVKTEKGETVDNMHVSPASYPDATRIDD